MYENLVNAVKLVRRSYSCSSFEIGTHYYFMSRDTSTIKIINVSLFQDLISYLNQHVWEHKTSLHILHNFYRSINITSEFKTARILQFNFRIVTERASRKSGIHFIANNCSKERWEGERWEETGGEWEGGEGGGRKTERHCVRIYILSLSLAAKHHSRKWLYCQEGQIENDGKRIKIIFEIIFLFGFNAFRDEFLG